MPPRPSILHGRMPCASCSPDHHSFGYLAFPPLITSCIPWQLGMESARLRLVVIRDETIIMKPFPGTGDLAVRYKDLLPPLVVAVCVEAKHSTRVAVLDRLVDDPPPVLVVKLRRRVGGCQSFTQQPRRVTQRVATAWRLPSAPAKSTHPGTGRAWEGITMSQTGIMAGMPLMLHVRDTTAA